MNQMDRLPDAMVRMFAAPTRLQMLVATLVVAASAVIAMIGGAPLVLVAIGGATLIAAVAFGAARIVNRPAAVARRPVVSTVVRHRRHSRAV